MSEPTAEYQAAIETITAQVDVAIRAFAKWYAHEWKLTREQWAKEFSEPVPSDDYFTGWNAACDAIESACEGFLGDYGP